MSAILDVQNLSISFGGLHAVDDFQITIEKGQLYGLIGPIPPILKVSADASALSVPALLFDPHPARRDIVMAAASVKLISFFIIFLLPGKLIPINFLIFFKCYPISYQKYCQ